MRYIFMNHRIRMKKPDGPVIVSLDDDGIRQEADLFELRVGGVLIGHIIHDKNGLEACDTHEVKAWVELHDAVQVVPVGKRAKRPEATEKKANAKVTT